MKHKINTLLKEFNVQNIQFDSRKIKPGDAFFAIKGEHDDGNRYIDEVLSKGVILVVTSDVDRQSSRIKYFEDTRQALSLAVSILYPKIPKNIIAVTGTNGKSSIVSYIHQILTKLDVSNACLGTLGVVSSNKEIEKLLNIDNTDLTTPDTILLHKQLNILSNHNIDNIALEASSHGLVQDRLGGIKIQTAAFASFSQDHLEYHGTMESYLQAKLLLFIKYLKPGGQAVINSEINKFDFIKEFLQKHNIKFCTVGKNADIRIKGNQVSLAKQSIIFDYNGREYKFETEIVGSFQQINLLMAAKLVNNLGYTFDKIINTLPTLKAVTGRLQRITKIDHDYQIFVDYAHTPDALEKSLIELLKLKDNLGKLYVIFGCGGDRDKLKRSIMGQIASERADKVIVTDDNPRTEDASIIRKQVLAGTTNNAIEVNERKKAINNTIKSLKQHDILLIAGKGHEDYQIIGRKKIKFSDIRIAEEAIQEDLK